MSRRLLPHSSSAALALTSRRKAFAGSNLPTDPKCPKCIYKILPPRIAITPQACSFSRSATSLGEAHIICDLSQHHLRQRLNLVHLCREAAMKLPLRANDVSAYKFALRTWAQMKNPRTKFSGFLAGLAGLEPASARVKVLCLTDLAIAL